MISANKDLLIDSLFNRLDEILLNKYNIYLLYLKYEDNYLISYIYENSIVIKREDKYDSIELKH